MTLTDTSPMPFGKYQGELLANVPASYFLWFRDNVKKRTRTEAAIHRYIEENLDVIRVEAAREGGWR